MRSYSAGIAGDVARPAVDLDAVAPRVESEHPARPRSGRRKSSRIRIVVVLPAPFGPRKPKIVPAGTER